MSTSAASVTALVKTIVGAGMLGVPFAFIQTGVLLGTLLLLFAGAAQWCALHLLAVLVMESHVSTPSYRSLALAAFGSDVGATVVETINAIHCFGTATSYLIVVGDLAPQLALYVGSHYLGGSWGWTLERRVWILLVGIALELPLFWQPTLNALKVTSTIGNMAVAIVAALTAAFALGVLHTTEPSDPVSWWPPPEQAAPTASKIGVLGVYVFAFACAMNLPTLVLELDGPTMRRIDTVVGYGVGISALLYVLVGCCGAVAFGASVAPNLLRSFPVDATAGVWSTASGVIARFAMTFTVVCTYPLLMHPARNAVSLVCLARPASTLGSSGWAALTLGMFACSLTVAMLVSSLDLALGLVGGSTGMLIGFIFPALFYLRINGRKAGLEHATEPKVQELGSETSYRLFGEAGARPNADWWRLVAYLLVIVGTLLIPVLVGAQAIKAMKNGHSDD